MYRDKTLVKDLGSFTVSGANSLHFIPAHPVHVKRVIFVMTTAETTTKDVVTYGKETAAAGSQVAIGTFDIPATAAANAVYFADVAKRGSGPTTSTIDSSTINKGGAGEILVNPGEAFYITSDGGGAAGVANVYIEYIPSGLQEPDFIEADVTLS